MPKLPDRKSLAHTAWSVEDRVVLGASDFFHRAVEIVRWPFERLAWAVENWIIWPLQEETAGWDTWLKAAAAGAVVLLAAAAAAAGLLVADPSGDGGRTSLGSSPAPASSAASANPDPKAKVETAKAAGPVLHGAKPEFSEESGGGIPESARDEAAAQAEANQGVAAVSPDQEGAKGGAAVAGPAAIDVARRFAGAFVLYETGRTDDRVKEVFAETASPELEQALLKRPPRLPDGVKVPKAKVLNIVSGPKAGSAYTLSVSLLRVGVTSELKLEMEKLAGDNQGTGSAKSEWRVTDVRG